MITSDSTRLADGQVEKLHHLRTNVKGEAELLIRDLPVTGGNFKRAWTMLTGRYENKRLLVAAYCSAFTALPKMKTESAADLRRIFHRVLTTVNSLEGIGRPISSGSDLFVHFVVELLNSKTRRDWEGFVTGSSYPPTYAALIKLQMLEAISAGKSESSSTKTETSG